VVCGKKINSKLNRGHHSFQVLKSRFSMIIGRQNSWVLMILMVITKLWSILQARWFWLTSCFQS